LAFVTSCEHFRLLRARRNLQLVAISRADISPARSKHPRLCGRIARPRCACHPKCRSNSASTTIRAPRKSIFADHHALPPRSVRFVSASARRPWYRRTERKRNYFSSRSILRGDQSYSPWIPSASKFGLWIGCRHFKGGARLLNGLICSADESESPMLRDINSRRNYDGCCAHASKRRQKAISPGPRRWTVHPNTYKL